MMIVSYFLLWLKNENEINKNKTEGNEKIKTANLCLFILLYIIKRILKKENYVNIGGAAKKYECYTSNGKLDVFLHLQKFQKEYINLNYSFKTNFIKLL